MIIKLRDTLAKRARSSSSHYRDIQQGLCTAPVKIGEKSVGWPIDEIKILNAARIAGLHKEEIKNLVKQLHTKRKQMLAELLEA